ncbi:N,N-dimethylformamidase beta subunit family domain-containing protein [Ruegeria atlantica]|uniref:N,N-dimethylformamidase beta subunit family domain-containing protein n=1 Tax=Ruegeria atlantica TaxID=81569 RepID=UPI001480147F|nr:N,N-dimethylformamidase beta subunit family domain-containing protein [Ruegeria atlantica]
MTKKTKDSRPIDGNYETGPKGPTRRAVMAAGAVAGAALPLVAQASQNHGLTQSKPFSSGPSTWRMPQGWRGLDLAFYEMSANDPTFLEIYAYCDAMSYKGGDTVMLHATTTAEMFDLSVWRDGPTRETVFEAKGVKGVFTETPKDAYANGCNWPVLAQIPVDTTWRSGVYIVELRVEENEETKVSEAGFVVRGSGKAKITYMLTTNTAQAYNMWGGANHYLGIHGEDNVGPSPLLSFNRPFERGFWVAPDNFPYLSTVPERLRYKNEPGYTAQPAPGYSLMMGYAWGANSAGWATDNRPFAVWAEENGYEIDYIDQTDLNRTPGVLDGYDCLVISGHDEYWSWEQRDAVDAFVDAGGKLARFAANMLWQVRMEGENGHQQICHKVNADENDPVAGTDRAHLLTTIWEHASINRPAAQTFSVTGLQGIYAAYDGAAPRSSAGFTIYRADHWALEGTALMYGDTFGMEEGVVGYETDSVDYTMRYGLPYASDLHGPLEGTEILAVTPGIVDQVSAGGPGDAVLSIGKGDFYARYYARSIEGNEETETVDKYRYGSAQIVVAPKGKGEIFCAGTVYWYLGLKWRDRTTQQITHNVLRRYTT